jgi:GNAT superfamily N-acetyltransferase
MMNFLRYCAVLSAGMSAGCLQAMEQQLENPFQALNNDPQCPLRFVRYDDQYKSYLKTILERGDTWKSLINQSQNLHTFDHFMNEMDRACIGENTNIIRYQYMILKQNNEVIGFIDWLRDNKEHMAALNYLAIDGSYRRQAIGMLALYEVLRWEKSQGTQRLSTSKLDSHNVRARLFFTSMKFAYVKCYDEIFYLMSDLQNKNLEPISQKLHGKNLISENGPLTTGSNSTPARITSSPVRATCPPPRSNSRAQIARMLDVTGKILGIGGALMSLACLTRSANPWLQQRARSVYSMTAALGGLCYGASRWMHNTIKQSI